MKTRIHIYLGIAAWLLSFNPFSASAQEGHYSTFTVGKQWNRMYLGNINRNVYLYNYTREWLTDKMDYFTGLEGMNFEVEERWDRMGMLLAFSGGSQNNHAEGPEPDNHGALGQRDIKVSLSNMNCGFTYYPIGFKHFELKLGASVDMSWFAINTQYNQGAAENILNAFKLGSTLSAQTNLYATNRIGVAAKAYYQFFYKSKVDIADMPYYFSGANFPYTMDDKINNYGVSLMVILSGSGRKDFY